MQTDYPIGNLVLYKGDANATIFYKSESSYAELLAVNDNKMVLHLWLLNTVIVVPKDKVCLTTVAPGKMTELEYFMLFFNKASRKIFGNNPPLRLQKKCLSALVQSMELTENALTRDQAIRIMMKILRLNN
jgi:hypothetical protein